MTNVNITLAAVGHMPMQFNKAKIQKWPSGIFEVSGDINTYTLPTDSDGPSWEFTDKNLERVLPNDFEGEFLIAIVNVPLELNWYSRRLSNNRIVFSFHEVKDILIRENIPLENVILRLMYAYSLVFLENNRSIPLATERTNFTHDETRGCLFDMNGIKSDIVESCDKPIICSPCEDRILKARISVENIKKTKKEISKIKKQTFYKILKFIQIYPILSILVSAIFAIVLGVLSSLIATGILSKFP
ncbi:MAG: hypothetical protein COA47_03460 [Robiginitomaculum sp.]|nr:MAG: hypothetical protein COA47_03460 [Robiginitomaculum sp.]